MKENKQPVIAIFDIGKTNKKLFLFNSAYDILFERSEKFTETADEDGFPCDNLDALVTSVYDAMKEVLALEQYEIKALNFTTYGASLVYIDPAGKALTPLYNYLKDYPTALSDKFYNDYGGREALSISTASPVLGSLNSGLQLYRLKYEKPDVFAKMQYALHLPQYISFLFTGKPLADITSIGCHTKLWDFAKRDYHDWVTRAGLLEKLPPIFPGDKAIPVTWQGRDLMAGVGLHDSSAALIPYLVSFREPFALISSGTWCITLNPFNSFPLTAAELAQDCLCYMTYAGNPVKAARIFSGNEHEQQVRRLSAHFHCDLQAYQQLKIETTVVKKLQSKKKELPPVYLNGLKSSPFTQRDLNDFENYAEAYHQLMLDLVGVQVESSSLVLEGTPVRRIFVDGGFGRNELFMELLAAALPEYEVYAASVPQATALGAALALHRFWNPEEVPANLVELKYFATP